MKFNQLFKNINYTESFLEEIERKLFDHKKTKISNELYDHNMNIVPIFTDIHREFLLFLQLDCLKNNEDPYFNAIDSYDPNRKLNPEVLYKLLFENLTILAPKLRKSIFDKDLDLFFKLILNNDYVFSYNKNNKTKEISIECEEHEPI